MEDTNADYKKEILERRRTEKALRESEEKYRVLVENATDVIILSAKFIKGFCLRCRYEANNSNCSFAV